MENRFDRFMEDNFFPYNQVSFLIHAVTLNLDLIGHLHDLQFGKRLDEITIKVFVDGVVERDKIFGYSDHSLQSAIRDLHDIGIIGTNRSICSDPHI